MPRALHAVLQTKTFRTPCDLFGMFRTYFGGPPSYTPDNSYTISDVTDSAQMAVNPVTHTEPSSLLYAPFPNITTFCLMSWHYWTSKVKSIQELQQLVDEVILALDFNSDDLHGFCATKEIEWMDSVPMIDGDDAARSVTNFISFLLYNTSRARDTCALPRFSYLASLWLVSLPYDLLWLMWLRHHYAWLVWTLSDLILISHGPMTAV